MGFYSAMFWGFSDLLPQQKIGDAAERAAGFFSVAWVGYLMLLDVVVFDGSMLRALGAALAVVLLLIGGFLYALHLVILRNRSAANAVSASRVESGDRSGISAALGVLFVLAGWGSILGAGALSRAAVAA